MIKKTILFMAVAAFAAITASAQQVDPPANVKQAFSLNFSAVKNPTWEKQEVIIYKARYNEFGNDYETYYSSEGQWLRTYNKIKEADIPAQISSQLSTIYKAFVVKQAGIELNQEGKFYLINLMNGKDQMDLYFTLNGKLVK